jgi:hypothetical protein
MHTFYFLKAVDGIYFAGFHSSQKKLTYTVDTTVAWRTKRYEVAEKMTQCLKSLYDIKTSIHVITDSE